MDIKFIQDLNLLMEHSDAWNELLKLNHNENPYMTLDWIAAWWKFYGCKYKLYIIKFTENNEILGFLPLMTQKKRIITEYRFICTPKSARNGFLVRPGYEKQVVAEAVFHLNSIVKGAVFNLQGMSKEDICFKLIIKDISDKKHVINELPFYYIHLEQNGREAYFQKIRRHQEIRKTINLEKSLCDTLPMHFLPAESEDVELIFPLHAKRWSCKNDGNGFGIGTSKQFFAYLAQEGNPHTIASPISFQTGVYLLWAGRLPIGFAYGLICNGHFAFYRIAHDNDFGIFKPGLIIVKELIERCFDLKLHFFDFSTGDDAYKLLWAEEYETVCQVLFGSETMLSRVSLSLELMKKKLRYELKKNKKIVYFKRVTLGRIKHAASGTPIRNFYRNARLALKQKSLANLLICSAKKLAMKTGISCQYRLYNTKIKNYYKPDVSGLTLHPADLDRLELLSNLATMSAEHVVRRYKNGDRCQLLYNGDIIVGFAWISKTQIGDSRRIIWKSRGSYDCCLYDLCFFKNLSVEKYESTLRFLAHECALSAKIKNARISFLIHRFDRHLIRAASAMFECESGNVISKEAMHENISD